MKIGKPVRAYVVEPLHEPAVPAQPEDEEEAAPAAEIVAAETAERERVPAA